MEEKKINFLNSFEINVDDATPMLRQFLQIKKNHQGTILLYRMGDFYETFFEDATVAAKSLEITLTSREGGKLGRIPMAGVPVKSAELYISRLIEKGHKVAICEQTQDPSEAKGLVERKVVKTITAGTITDSNLLDSTKNNYLAAIIKADKDLFGLSYIDISTAEFKITHLNFEQLKAELARISPSEIIAPTKKQKLLPFQVVPDEKFELPQEIIDNYSCTKRDAGCFTESFAQKKIKEAFQVKSLEAFGYPEYLQGLIAAGAIIDYIEQTQQQNMPKFDVLSPYSLSAYVSMDSTTRKNLELKETLRDKNKKGSLLWAIDRTSTNMGTRLLTQWIQQPLQDVDEINSRQASVDELLSDPHLCHKLKSILEKVYDIERLATRISNNSANGRDYVSLKDSLSQIPELEEILKGTQSKYLSSLKEDNSDLHELAMIIGRTIQDNPPITIKEGGLIKEGVSTELDYQKGLLTGGKEWLEKFEETEKEKTGIKSLKVGYSKTFGYFIEVTHSNTSLVPENYVRKQTLTNAERYITEELKNHETEVLSAQSKSTEMEYKIFCDLREYSKEFVSKIRKTAEALSTLDVLLSFASIATEQNYIRPIVDDSNTLMIKGARHAVIEQLLPMGNYVANDLNVTSAKDKTQFMILTGPNMAGKSTYMRQNALVIILAQIGSFVPAREAHIGVVDKIFTRVGSVDDLSTGQSTFMVEMNETALILNSATEKSFILLDEIGRGTSTYDGVAIAWSVAEYIANTIGARSIFATHYHELNVMCNTYPQIKNFRMTINEKNDNIEFLYQVVPGGASKSYGIQVAKMAGLPEGVISRSKNLMAKMQKDYSKKLNTRQKDISEAEPQLTLFAE